MPEGAWVLIALVFFALFVFAWFYRRKAGAKLLFSHYKRGRTPLDPAREQQFVAREALANGTTAVSGLIAVVIASAAAALAQVVGNSSVLPSVVFMGLVLTVAVPLSIATRSGATPVVTPSVILRFRDVVPMFTVCLFAASAAWCAISLVVVAIAANSEQLAGEQLADARILVWVPAIGLVSAAITLVLARRLLRPRDAVDEIRHREHLVSMTPIGCLLLGQCAQFATLALRLASSDSPRTVRRAFSNVEGVLMLGCGALLLGAVVAVALSISAAPRLSDSARLELDGAEVTD